MRETHEKVVFFDTGDSAGSRCFGVLDSVDIFLKKQVYEDFGFYLEDHGERNLMRWIPEELNSYNRKYDVPSKENLKKVKVAWNIGLCQLYSVNRWISAAFSDTGFGRYLPFKWGEAYRKGTLLTAYRVGSFKDRRYSYQRKKIETVLKTLAHDNIIVGNKVSKKQYLQEMANSKAIISPYGWGEICYRDFETIINGSLLIKPTMKNIITYPDIYKSEGVNQTYLPIGIDASRLSNTLDLLIERDFIEVVKSAQSYLKSWVTNSNVFVSHLRSLFQ